jgi:hypothetical protein
LRFGYFIIFPYLCILTTKTTHMRSTGIWHIKTNKINDYKFYHGNADSNPFNTIKAFDKGDNWCIDAGGYSSSLKEVYKTYSEDDSFVLIPKSDVLDVWFVSYQEDNTHAPKLVYKRNFISNSL